MDGRFVRTDEHAAPPQVAQFAHRGLQQPFVLFDEATGLLAFPYSVDERGGPREPRPPGNGATEYVLRTGRPLLADRAKLDQLVQAGELRELGEHAWCWLGVPLLRGARAVGVLAVQSYSPQVRYGEPDRELLGFVAAQVAYGLERREAGEQLRAANLELEQHVAARTGELISRNAELEAANPGRDLSDPFNWDQALEDAFVQKICDERKRVKSGSYDTYALDLSRARGSFVPGQD